MLFIEAFVETGKTIYRADSIKLHQGQLSINQEVELDLANYFVDQNVKSCVIRYLYSFLVEMMISTMTEVINLDDLVETLMFGSVDVFELENNFKKDMKESKTTRELQTTTV